MYPCVFAWTSISFCAEEEKEEEEGSRGGEAHSPMTWQPPSPLWTSDSYKTYLPSLEVEEGSEVFPRLRATTNFKKDQDSTSATSAFVGAGRGKHGTEGEMEAVVERAEVEVLQHRELREELQNLRIQLQNKCVVEPFLFFVSLSFVFGIDLVLAET